MRGRDRIGRVLLWPLLLASYLLFATSLETNELIAGVVLATLALLPVLRLRGRYAALFGLRPRWLFPLGKIPWAMLQESFLLCRALARQLAGHGSGGTFIEWQTAPEDERAPARRALLTFGVCVTPNSYLVYLDRKTGKALVRQLEGKELSDIDRNFLELP